MSEDVSAAEGPKSKCSEWLQGCNHETRELHCIAFRSVFFCAPPPTLAGQDGTHISLAQIGSLREQLSHFEALAETQRNMLHEQQAQVEEVALGVLHSMLCRLQLPTLQQALRDLGMPAEGGKSELTSRLAGAMQEDLILPPR